MTNSVESDARAFRDAAKSDLESGTHKAEPLFNRIMQEPGRLEAVSRELEKGNSEFSSSPVAQVDSRVTNEVVSVTFSPGLFEFHSQQDQLYIVNQPAMQRRIDLITDQLKHSSK